MALKCALAGFGVVALLVAGAPARAQLGTSGNVPPQHLFNTDQPPRLDTGLGTMAERRARLAHIRNGEPIRSRHDHRRLVR